MILVHGVGQGPSDWALNVANNVLKGAERSVLVVDWSQTGEESFLDFDYAQALANALLVGRQIAVVIKNFVLRKNLLTLKNVKTAHIHFVGFAEGAQMAVSFADHLYELTGMTIYRMTALNPTSPFFETFNQSISQKTAKYVDVVHTSAGLSAPGFYNHIRIGQLGIMRPLGHLDVYFNGGTTQPGCNAINDLLCSHRRAFEYLLFATDPRTPCVFNMYNCTGTAQLGSMCGKRILADIYSLEYSLLREPRGIRMVKVSHRPPFCE
ncbi:lipase member I-like [Galendromus occidentalis]|uniref:Lipase member I-like n=1 Tax=Galendromus occidentalis TaxID=34638 RepID=A0AAJ7P998_9ACAR|nr:lipase member I-like [Galendromus occidentalis]